MRQTRLPAGRARLLRGGHRRRPDDARRAKPREWERSSSRPRHFLRVHRSTIVNVDHVERIEPGFKAGSG
ncbi:MAG: LytTR family transcriptional regulator [Holophagales bacterium]|nr:LytTR family transcriptional regulator [Holophagales bacterium]